MFWHINNKSDKFYKKYLSLPVTKISTIFWMCVFCADMPCFCRPMPMQSHIIHTYMHCAYIRSCTCIAVVPLAHYPMSYPIINQCKRRFLHHCCYKQFELLPHSTTFHIFSSSTHLANHQQIASHSFRIQGTLNYVCSLL